MVGSTVIRAVTKSFSNIYKVPKAAKREMRALFITQKAKLEEEKYKQVVSHVNFT